MFKSCSGDKNLGKDKTKKRKELLNSKSKDNKDKKTHIKQSNSSRDSRSRKIQSIRQKQTELGNICERKGIGEKQKESDEYFCHQKRPNKTKKGIRNKSEINNFFLHSNDTNPTWNYISYGQAKEDSSKKETSDDRMRLTTSRGSLGLLHRTIRQSRTQTNENDVFNPESKVKQKKQKKKSKKKREEKKISTSPKKQKSKSDGKKKSSKKTTSKEKKKKEKKISEESKKYQKRSESPIQFLNINQINFKHLHEEIEDENENIRQYILSTQNIKQRAKCLNMLGKICSSMSLKRQTHSIAVAYIDKFLDSTVETKMIKTVVISALMMALKVDHAQSVGTLVYQFSSLSSFQGLSTSTEAKSQPKTIKKLQRHEREEHYRQEQAQTPHLRFNLNRPKQPNLFTAVLSCEQIFSEYDHILCKEEIADVEMQMMIKLNFKLSVKSVSHWIDTLVLIWDSYIRETYPTLRMKLLYKTQKNITNFSYLNQLVETAFYCIHTYSYSRVLIILSFMYIITRIFLEFGENREEKGFQSYKLNLGKSSNAIFVDKLGVNELFGQFLSLLNLEMGDIVNCCQYVSRFLNYKILKVYSVDHKESSSIIEPLVTGYQYNPELYRYVFTKIYQ